MPPASSGPAPYDTIVIGGGQAGAFLEATLVERGESVAVIERRHLGGTCVNQACTPTGKRRKSPRVTYLARARRGAAPYSMGRHETPPGGPMRPLSALSALVAALSLACAGGPTTPEPAAPSPAPGQPASLTQAAPPPASEAAAAAGTAPPPGWVDQAVAEALEWEVMPGTTGEPDDGTRAAALRSFFLAHPEYSDADRRSLLANEACGLGGTEAAHAWLANPPPRTPLAHGPGFDVYVGGGLSTNPSPLKESYRTRARGASSRYSLFLGRFKVLQCIWSE